jgi:hypothetical protein
MPLCMHRVRVREPGIPDTFSSVSKCSPSDSACFARLWALFWRGVLTQGQSQPIQDQRLSRPLHYRLQVQRIFVGETTGLARDKMFVGETNLLPPRRRHLPCHLHCAPLPVSWISTSASVSSIVLQQNSWKELCSLNVPLANPELATSFPHRGLAKTKPAQRKMKEIQ